MFEIEAEENEKISMLLLSYNELAKDDTVI